METSEETDLVGKPIAKQRHPKFKGGRTWKLYNAGILASLEAGSLPPLYWTDPAVLALKDGTDWYCGVEVHKTFIWVALYGQVRANALQKVLGPIDKFEYCDAGLAELIRLVAPFQPRRFLMETTGVYHVAVYWKLRGEFDPAGTNRVIVMNAHDVKQKMSHAVKTDKADAQKLAQLAGFPELLQPSLVPPVDLFMLRSLLRRRNKLVDDATRVKNRVKTDLSACGLQWPFKWKNVGQVCLVRQFVRHDVSLGEFIESAASDPLLAGPVKKYGLELAKWGALRLPEAARFSLGMLLADTESLQIKLEVVEKYIHEKLAGCPALHDPWAKLEDLPGAGVLYLTGLVLESGDVSRFNCAKSYVVYAGIAPATAKSGTEKILRDEGLAPADAKEVQKAVKKDKPNDFAQGHLKHCTLRIANQILIDAGKAEKRNSQRDDGPFIQSSDLESYARKILARDLPWMKMVYKVASKVLRGVYYCLKTGTRYDPFHEQHGRSEQPAPRGVKVRVRQKSKFYKDQCQLLKDNYEQLLDRLESFPLEEAFRSFLKEARGTLVAKPAPAAGRLEQGP